MEKGLSSLLRCPTGPVDLRTTDPGATPGLPKGTDKKHAPVMLDDLGVVLSDLQERLHASGVAAGEKASSVLLVLQGLDTSGKGGVIRHVAGQVDPQGLQIASFKAPTAEERAHDFLWRIEPKLPAPGMIGVFDRSHYEDVLIQRVEAMAPPEEIERRYGAINDFEARIASRGTRIVKCYLHVSRAEQKQRLAERLANPEKYYEYNPGDVDVAKRFDDYIDAYNIALSRCNTDVSPWYVVPSDRKWYRNWAIAGLLVEVLGSLDLGWPAADFDVAAEKQRVAGLPES